jgi:hypothetical protein
LRELNGINGENGKRHHASRQAVSPTAPELGVRRFLAQCRLALLPLRVGERAGGMFVVLALIGAADDDALVSGAPVAVSISELARRIGSSRTHVIMLLNDAAADGLVDRSSGNGIVLLPRLSEAATNSSPSGICSSRIAQRLYGRGM